MKRFSQTLRHQTTVIFTDPGALLVLVGAVVIYSFFYPLPYAPEVIKESPVVVVDRDRSSLSRQLIRMVDAHELLAVESVVEDCAQAQAALRAGRVRGYLDIPAGFRRDVLRGQDVTLALGGDGTRFIVNRQVLTGLSEVTGTLAAGLEIRRLRAAGRSGVAAMAARDPAPLVTRPLFNTREGYGSYVLPAVLVMVLQQTLLIGIGMLGATQRDPVFGRGTAPWPEAGLPVLLGRAAPFFLLYLANALFFLGFSTWFHDLPRPVRLLESLTFLLPFLLAVIFLGFVLERLFREREHSMQLIVFTSVPLIFMAGFGWPFEMVPAPLAGAAWLVPSTAGIQGFVRLNQMGAEFSEVLRPWAVLWGLSLLYGMIAWAGMRRPREQAGLRPAAAARP